LEDITDVAERDIEYNMFVDISDIISCQNANGDRAKAFAIALEDASGLHWT
jgi:hypothetical protein